MRLTVCAPSPESHRDVTGLWEILTSLAVPFPVEFSELKIVVTRCDDVPDEAEATATVTTWSARVCLTDALLRRTRDVQIAVLLHELIHIHLYLTRLGRNLAVSREIRDADLGYDLTDEEVVFRCVRKKFAVGFLNLVAEVGVDRYMAAHYHWVSTSYWETRTRNLYLDARLAADENITVSLQPYASFYRRAALELGVEILGRVGMTVEHLRSRLNECVMPADPALEAWLARVLAFDPTAAEQDESAYDEVCRQILTLTE